MAIITHKLHACLGDPTVAGVILNRLMQQCRRFNPDGVPDRRLDQRPR
ncbi:hypothetical protein [Variovorax soli]|uniref:Uncharacterized protein n=1 Tax=Variovorax soli TaxID=376815 RepID=A0ABU1NMA3_9BURK|nr:hypothetical protein [Variovorax soli]MDR6539473.1 hypothetical protein [Variovorax soli]